MYPGAITDVPGILLGHATDRTARTGVTAIIAPNGAVAGVDVRGGGPGTRETDAVAPGRLVEKINAVLLCGGSAFGLDAASGAMKYLEKKGMGYDVGVTKVPIVSAAVLFDLKNGAVSIRPDETMGMLACLYAGRDTRQGLIGAGCGATTGKLVHKLVPGCLPDVGGLGSASITLPDGTIIGAVAAVNAAGDIVDPNTGVQLAGAHLADGTPVSSLDVMLSGGKASAFSGNTTISCLATNAKLTREQCARLALMMHDGYARAIRPVHLPVDGDTTFALSVGEAACENFVALCAAAAEVTARAIANAPQAARGDRA